MPRPNGLPLTEAERVTLAAIFRRPRLVHAVANGAALKSSPTPNRSGGVTDLSPKARALLVAKLAALMRRKHRTQTPPTPTASRTAE